MTKHTTVTIANMTDREEGKRKIERLKEMTKYSFYNFEFGLCPIGGSFDVTATSDYEFDENDHPEVELLRVLTSILFRTF